MDAAAVNRRACLLGLWKNILEKECEFKYNGWKWVVVVLLLLLLLRKRGRKEAWRGVKGLGLR